MSSTDHACPTCGALVYAWCSRGGRVQPGETLACPERARLDRQRNVIGGKRDHWMTQEDEEHASMIAARRRQP
jgi:hypothetical protein